MRFPVSRWATLLYSNFLLGTKQLAAVTGSIYFDVPEGGTVGSIRTAGYDSINGHSHYAGVSSVEWDVGESGTITAASDISLVTGTLWDVTGDFVYGSNVYNFFAEDSTAKFVCYGNGGYGGASFSRWSVLFT